jgi:YegS/Rv2252/BmrU family lipid kinase
LKVGMILNPASGRRGLEALRSTLRRAFETHGAGLTLLETERAGDAERLARGLADDGADLVVAVGGDGTIGEVAGGVLKSGRPDTAFSFIATGTGCDFQRNFSLPVDPVSAVAHVMASAIRRIDAGVLACHDESGNPITRHFANIASFGVSGQIVRAVNAARNGRRLPGPAVFLFHSMWQILRYRPCSVRLRLDGADVYESPITAVAVANGAWFGGGMQVAPGADLTDGFFDVVIMRGAPRFKVLTLLNSIYSGAHLKSPLVTTHRARCVEAWPIGKDAALIDSDGEAPGQLPARFDILPSALSIRI